MVKRFSAAFQSRIGIVHFLLMFLGRERTTRFDDLAQAHVNRLDGVRGVPQEDFLRGVNDLADFRRVVEERNDASPVAAPAQANRLIVLLMRTVRTLNTVTVRGIGAIAIGRLSTHGQQVSPNAPLGFTTSMGICLP
jgi:hypothetical protein